MGRVTGLKPRELAQVRGRLMEFAEDMLTPIPRRDSRGWGERYLRGLMLDGRRKSIQPMAERLEDGDEQCLQQFVNQSPWDWTPVRERLAKRMVSEIEPEGFVIDDTGFPKFGTDSVGVAHQYSGTLGKVGNCQVGVSITACTDRASCPLDWRLFLPESWDTDTERRARAHLPADERHRPKWELALECLDELDEWEIAPVPVLADAGYGDITDFRTGLEQRGLDYVVQVKGTTSAFAEHVSPETPDYSGRGRPPAARYREGPSSLRALALETGEDQLVEVAWREGSRERPLGSRFVALRIRPANLKLRRAAAGGELALRWLLCEWPEGAAEPVKYWLANLDEDTDLERLVHLAKLRWRIEHDYRELKDALGLDHFEGRSFRGWHHHVTLVAVAHGFLTIERLNPKARAAA